MILGAAYMLWLVQRVFYGPQSELIQVRPANDLHFRELALLWPLAVLTLVMGVAPSIWLSTIQQGIQRPPLTTQNGPRRVLRVFITSASVPPGGQR